MDDKELERIAQEELLQEAKRAKSRAEEMGPMGWQRCPLPSTNKRFLHNVLVSTLEPRKKKSRKEPSGSKDKVQNSRSSHKDREHKNTAKNHNKSADKDRHKHRKHKRKQQKRDK